MSKDAALMGGRDGKEDGDAVSSSEQTEKKGERGSERKEEGI